MIVYWILLLLTAVFAYFAGSLSTQRLASLFFFRGNLRKLGKGNVWISNFRRLYGIPGFLKLLLVEVVKDLLPILLGGLLLGIINHGDVGRAFAGFCLLMGRLFPVFNRFRGCHGSVALVVAALCLEPSMGVAVAVMIALTDWFLRYLSLGSLIGALVMVITAILVVDMRLCMVLCILTAALVIVRHLPAVPRLLNQTEPRLSFEQDISYKFDEKF